MLSSYKFDSNYQPAANLSQSSFRLLEDGIFSHEDFCPVLTQELDQLRIHYLQWGNEGIHYIHSRHSVTPVNHLAGEHTLRPSRRCLIPTNAYYFKTPDGRAWKIESTDQETFCFGGILYQRENTRGEASRHFSILATAAHDELKAYHGLMPVIIPRQLEAAWLNPNTSIQKIQEWLTQPQAHSLTICEVQYLHETDHAWSHLAA